MNIEFPKIDKRGVENLLREIELRVPFYVPEWKISEKDPGYALITIFIQMFDSVIQRLNRVPEKNFLAFLDTVGISLLPAQSATAPVTFSLSEGTREHILVPAATQVAAEDVVFETTKNMLATPSRLIQAFSIDSNKDYIFKSPANVVSGASVAPFQAGLLYDAQAGSKQIFVSKSEGLSEGDILIIGSEKKKEYGIVSEVSDSKVKLLHKLNYGHLASIQGENNTGKELVEKVTSFPLFEGRNIQEHAIYLGHNDLFNIKGEATLAIRLECSKFGLKLADTSVVQWEYWGEAIIMKGTKEIKEIDWHPLAILTSEDRDLLEVHLEKELQGEIKECEISGIKSRWIRCRAKDIAGTRDVNLDSMQVCVKGSAEQPLPDMAFYNDVPINIGTADQPSPFHPFGSHPLQYDIFYIASQECFSKKDTEIHIKFALGRPGQSTTGVKLSWEYWNGKGWNNIPNITDNTANFTVSGGDVLFACPQDIMPVKVNGQENYWLRVRIVEGNYGEAKYIEKPEEGWVTDPSLVIAPLLNNLFLTYEEAPQSLEHCLTFNNLEFKDHTDETRESGKLFNPFIPFDNENQALYLGFDIKLERGPVRIFFSLEEQEIPKENIPKIEWCYFSRDKGWMRLEVSDSTQNLTRSGTVEFYIPTDFAKISFFAHKIYWIKAKYINEITRVPPKVKGIYVNTTYAIQAESIKDEILGSSDLSTNQIFQLTRNPVIEEEIWVNETGILSSEEKKKITEQKGRYSVIEHRDETGKITEVWVRWQPVEDFLASTSKDRHYEINRTTGEIKFGDGLRGLIPPAGSDNIKASYRVGGGKKGNVAAFEISTLKSSIPYVEKVSNPEPAVGGSDIEKVKGVLKRGPYLIKHRNRAVTEEDFERIACAASSRIARTKCIIQENKIKIIVVPEGKEDKPIPSLWLLKIVEKHILQRALNLVSPECVEIHKPEYVEISINVSIVPESMELAVPLENEILMRLKDCLHPLTGGTEKTGWEFGRDVHISDVYALLEGIDGVDHVENLFLNGKEHDVIVEDHRTVSSGKHTITMKFGGYTIAAP